MMKYYKLQNSLDVSVTGKYPQSKASKNIAEINKISNYGWEGPIKDLPYLPKPILQPRSRATTFLEIQMTWLVFLVFKKYFLEFLKNFNLGKYQFWDIDVEHKKRILKEYCLFHLSYPSQEKYVNYSKSEFYIGKLTDWEYRSESIKISSYKNYLSTREVLMNDDLYPKCNSIIFDLSNVQEDLFRFTNVPGVGYYVSERLKNAIEERRFTGMDFKEIEEYDKKIKVIY